MRIFVTIIICSPGIQFNKHGVV